MKFKNQASVDKVEQCQLHMVDNKKVYMSVIEILQCNLNSE